MGKMKNELNFDDGLDESNNMWYNYMSSPGIKNTKPSSVNIYNEDRDFETSYPAENWIIHHLSSIKDGDRIIYKDHFGKIEKAEFASSPVALS